MSCDYCVITVRHLCNKCEYLACVQYLGPKCIQILYKYCMIIASQEIGLQLFKIGTNLQTGSQTCANFLLGVPIWFLGSKLDRSITQQIKLSGPTCQYWNHAIVGLWCDWGIEPWIFERCALG